MAQQKNDTSQEARARYGMMKVLRESAPRVSQKEWVETMKQHVLFLENGGGGGKWQTVSVGEGPAGTVLAIYLGPKTSTGAQASFMNKSIEGLPLKGANLSYSNMVGARAQKQNFDGANLQGICATDADFSGSSFKHADLRGADFSRSLMTGCDFTGATLEGDVDRENVDFENADMTGVIGEYRWTAMGKTQS